MKRKNKQPFIASILPAVLLTAMMVATACESPPVNFTRADRRMIDSLFIQQKPDIDKKVDSLCREWADGRYDTYRDSLLQQRWSEIEKLLKSDD